MTFSIEEEPGIPLTEKPFMVTHRTAVRALALIGMVAIGFVFTAACVTVLEAWDYE